MHVSAAVKLNVCVCVCVRAVTF